MPYRSKAERERENWMTLPEAVVHISLADNCGDETVARRQLVMALADGELWPLKWEKERGGRVAPSFGYTAVPAPTDTPPRGRDWLQAKIRWKTGKVRDDWSEHQDGKWRVLLIHRLSVEKHWPFPTVPHNAEHIGPESEKAVNLSRRRRGRPAELTSEITKKMRGDLVEKRVTPGKLRGMKEEELKAKYGASRDTCRKARETVLSESLFAGNSGDPNSDK
jgi:hypothetical protein